MEAVEAHQVHFHKFFQASFKQIGKRWQNPFFLKAEFERNI
jgi:hypothetical protein